MSTNIELYDGAWARRDGDEDPQQVCAHRSRPGCFYVVADLYFTDGTPAEPGLFETPAIREVLSPTDALQMTRATAYNPNAGYQR